MENTRRDKIRRAVLLLVVFGFIGILIGLIILSSMLFDAGVRCPFYEIFNWHCPGCGATRMAVEILHGNFYGALRYNAFIFVTLPLLLPIMAYQAYLYIMKNELIPWLDKFLIGYSIALLIFGILRNMEILSWLAPTVIQ